MAIVSAIPARSDGEPIRIGERLTLPSKILGEQRAVYVSLPESYARVGQRYPVLYITDAPLLFEQTRATAAFIANELIPWAATRYRTVRIRPGLFQAIVAASPAWDDERELKELVPIISHDDVGRSLLFSAANEGPEMQAN
jgi:predicted alpha/beta superfamily hydrolase